MCGWTRHDTAPEALTMHLRLVDILNQLRGGLAQPLAPAVIEDVCRQQGHTWRQRLLDPVTTVHLFLIQILHGNTAINHLPHLSGLSFTDSAYAQARARLPLAVFRALLARVAAALTPTTHRAEGTWQGHRLILADGSSFSMPDTPELQAHFGQSRKARPGCGFPVAHLMVVVHAATGLLLGCLTAPLHTHDMSLVRWVHLHLEPGDVLVADRGFCSFAHLALLLRRGAAAVFRLHQKQIVDFTPGRPHVEPSRKRAPKGMPRSRWLYAQGLMDQVVEYFKPTDRPEWLSEEEYRSLPASIRVRELRYRVTAPGFRTREVTVVTTLLDAARYPAREVAAVYGLRWSIELDLRHLKTTMGLDVLKCQSVEGVEKELAVFALVYNLVRAVMLEAAERQGVGVDRISFVDALRWLAESEPGAGLPELVVNPARPGRVDPRVIKRRPKNYPWMSEPRRAYRKRMLEQGDTAEAA
jgi:Transposase DDE domain